MEDEKYQKELFEFEKPKRFFPKLSDFFPKADFERNVVLTITLDRAVFIAIGIIMVMVAVYALGVEKGKQRLEETAQKTVTVEPGKEGLNLPAPVQAQAVMRIAAPSAVPRPIASPAQPAVKRPPPAAIRPISTAAGPYTIVAVTFVQKDLAVQEMNKLKGQGLDTALIQSGRYFLVCVGAYSDKTGPQSQKDLKKMRRLYKDAYLKLK
ncbi:MAG: hypothetical protein WC522_02985 [Candidatus Omnitrophota bacterium]